MDTKGPAGSSGTATADLFAAYGEALYLAQSMETGMRIFYCLDKAFLSTPHGKVPRVDFDEDPLPEAYMNSLGGFIRQFRRELLEEGTIDVQTRGLMRNLEQAASDRNWLVHSFWWERSDQFGQAEGRAGMLAELQQLIASFRDYDDLIRRLVLVYIEQYGLEPEAIPSDRLQAYLSSGTAA